MLEHNVLVSKPLSTNDWVMPRSIATKQSGSNKFCHYKHFNCSIKRWCKLLLTAEASDAIRKGSARTHIKRWMKDKAPHGETHGRLSISHSPNSKVHSPYSSNLLLLGLAALICVTGFWNKSMFLISTHLSKQLSLANKNNKHKS